MYRIQMKMRCRWRTGYLAYATEQEATERCQQLITTHNLDAKNIRIKLENELFN